MGKKLELYRCKSDRRLLTDALCAQGFCAGHYLAQPAYAGLLELILLKLGVYEQVAAAYWRLLCRLSK